MEIKKIKNRNYNFFMKNGKHKNKGDEFYIMPLELPMKIDLFNFINL